MGKINTEKLLQDIQDAFTNSEYPGDDHLFITHSYGEWEIKETRENFRGKHWKDLSIEVINKHRDDLLQFTSEAFCFYLPAFLTASITYPLSLIDVLPSNVIYILNLHDEILEENDWLNDILRILTLPQKGVVRDFIEWDLNKYILDWPGFPEDLKDLLSVDSKRYLKFWQLIVSSASEPPPASSN